jgi:hypothetical protein
MGGDILTGQRPAARCRPVEIDNQNLLKIYDKKYQKCFWIKQNQINSVCSSPFTAHSTYQ